MEQSLKKNNEQITQAFNDTLQAIWMSNEGNQVWAAHNEFTVSFVIEPRYVPERDWDLNMDEIISNSAYVLSEERCDADLTAPEPFAAIIDGLRSANLAMCEGESILFDSFASEREFESEVLRAIEHWDMEQEETPSGVPEID
jgi:hypothetical protein